MQLLDLTLETPAENLALDEALLEEAERGDGPGEVLRLWESPEPLVVIGRASQVGVEVNEAECNRLGFPVLRRCSGGAAIVAGPGCLMYAVVLGFERQGHLRMVEQAHQHVLGVVRQALRSVVPGVDMQGTSDLTIDGRKFSGNSLRCKRHHLLYHGTLLYDFPLSLVATCLGTPPRQPEYRQCRGHLQFVRNLPVGGAVLRRALIDGWKAHSPRFDWPRELTRQLVDRQYSLDSWNFRR